MPLAVGLVDFVCVCSFCDICFVVCVRACGEHACMRACAACPVAAAAGSFLYITFTFSLICVRECVVIRKGRREGGRKGAGMFGFILLLER